MSEKPSESLRDQQRAVKRGQVIGLAIATIVLGLGIALVPTSLTDESTPGERLAFALKADILVVFWLVHCVAMLGRHRFYSAEDIGGAGLTSPTAKARELQAVLQNTLEQVVLAIVVHALWAVVMPVRWAAGILAATGLFALGRFFFIRGYSRGAGARALGFVLSFYPTMFMLFVVIVVTIITSVRAFIA